MILFQHKSKWHTDQDFFEGPLNSSFSDSSTCMRSFSNFSSKFPISHVGNQFVYEVFIKFQFLKALTGGGYNTQSIFRAEKYQYSIINQIILHQYILHHWWFTVQLLIITITIRQRATHPVIRVRKNFANIPHLVSLNILNIQYP